MTTLNVKNDVGVRARRKRGTKSIGPAGSVIVYLRVSTSEQALSGLGLEAQRATVAAYAERKGLTIVHEYCDEGISAKSLNGSAPKSPSGIQRSNTVIWSKTSMM